MSGGGGSPNDGCAGGSGDGSWDDCGAGGGDGSGGTGFSVEIVYPESTTAGDSFSITGVADVFFNEGTASSMEEATALVEQFELDKQPLVIAVNLSETEAQATVQLLETQGAHAIILTHR